MTERKFYGKLNNFTSKEEKNQEKNQKKLKKQKKKIL